MLVMEASIAIESSDFSKSDLFSDSANGLKEIQRGIFLRYERTLIREAVNFPPITELTIIVGRDIVLPIAIGILSNFLYDKLKNKDVKSIKVNGVEMQLDKDKISELISKELVEKPSRVTYTARLSMSEIPEEELLASAGTLSHRPITFNGRKLPFPDNQVYFSDQLHKQLELTLYVRDNRLNKTLKKGKELYAKTESELTPIFNNLIFTGLALDTARLPFSRKLRVL